MHYKGLKMMKRMAALAVSAALMLAETGAVSAAEYEQETTMESAEEIASESEEKTEQTASDEGTMPPGGEQKPGGETTPPGGEQKPGGETTPPDGETTPPDDETTPPDDETTPPGGEQKPGGETTPPGGEQKPGGETTPPGGEQKPGGETTPPGGEQKPGGETTPPGGEQKPGGETNPPAPPAPTVPQVQFKYYSNNSAEKKPITESIKISVDETVMIEASLSTQLPSGTDVSVQWSGDADKYVAVKDVNNTLGASTVELKGLKPTAGSIAITCVFTYKKDGKEENVLGVLNVSVNPLAEKVVIKLGDKEVQGSTVIYDIETGKFVAIGEESLAPLTGDFGYSVYPQNANQGITWKSSASSVIRFDDENSSKFVCRGVGKATVTATATDGSKNSNSKPVSASVTVKVRRIVKTLSFTAKSADGTELEKDKSGRYEIASGATIYLVPEYTPEDATEKQIKWENMTSTADKAIDKQSGSDNVLKVTAKKVSVPTDVTLKATVNDMGGASCDVKFVVKPRVEKINIYEYDAGKQDIAGDVLNDKIIGVDLGDNSASKKYLLMAKNELGESQKVKWTTSDEKIAALTPNPDGTCIVDAKAQGRAVIKATVADGSGTSAAVTFTVAALAKEIKIDGSSMVMKGKIIKLTATAYPLSVGNVKFKWESLTRTLATVNDKGEVKGSRCGVAIIRATAQDGSQVSAIYLVKVTETAEKFDIINMEGEVITGKLAGIDPDMDKAFRAAMKIEPKEEACQKVEWKSSNEKIVTVEAYGDNGVIITPKAIGKATVTAKAIDGSGKTASIPINVNTLSKSVTITGNHYLASQVKDNKDKKDTQYGTLQLKAVVGDKDAANKSVTWKSDEPKIANVDENGLVTATGKDGIAVITATAADGSGASATHDIYVRNGKCKTDISVKSDGYKLLPDKKTMIVDISGKEYIDIDLAASLTGHTQESAKDEDKEAEAEVPFEFTWSTSSKSIATVERDRDNPSVGKVRILRKGDVNITATSEDGCESGKTIKITVTNKTPLAKITGPSERLANGKKMKLSAGGVDVYWESDNESIATVSSSGQVTADRNETGSVKITATPVDDGVPIEGAGIGTYEIFVGSQAESIELLLNGTEDVTNDKVGVDIITGCNKAPDYNKAPDLNLTARLKFSDGDIGGANKHVTWKSSNNGIAAIDEDGKVTLKKIGNVTFTATATDGSGKKARVTFAVAKQLKGIAPAGGRDVYVGLKKSVQLYLTYTPVAAAKRKVIWESDAPDVVSVGKTSGKITGKKIGTATITATAEDNESATCTFTVNVGNSVSKVEIVKEKDNAEYGVYGIDLSEAEANQNIKLKANLIGSEGELSGSDVTWSSSNTSIATVDENGVVTGRGNGEATITAMALDGSRKSGKAKVYCGRLIREMVDNTEEKTLDKGISLKLGSKTKKTYDLSNKFKIMPVTATNQKFTYAVTGEDKKVATVNAKGIVTAKKAGTTTITVTPKDGSGAVNGTIKTITVTVE